MAKYLRFYVGRVRIEMELCLGRKTKKRGVEVKLQQQLKSMRAVRVLGFGACAVLLFLLGIMIFPPVKVDNSSAANAPVEADSSVGLEIGGVENSTLAFNMKPTSVDGTFAESDVMTIKASTNSFTGYTLSIAAQEGVDSTKLVSTDANCTDVSKCAIVPLSSSVTKSNYENPSGSAAVEAVRNTWGFSPSQYLGNDSSVEDNSATDGTEVYLPISTTATNLAKTNSANASGTSNSYTIKIGARIDTTIPMGTYENTFVIAAVGNGANFSIAYVDNSGDGNVVLPNNQSELTYDTTVQISSTVPSRTGYYFAGWCSAETSTLPCSGTTYQPNGDFYIDQTASSNTITLYAMWGSCTGGKICYHQNNSAATGSMGEQTASSNADITLLTPNFALSDYGFAGWSEDANAAVKLVSGTTVTIYGPTADITTGDLSTSGMNLYAVWVPVAKDSSGNELTFQTTDLFGTALAGGGTLSAKSNGYVTALKDERDNRVYAVAKLADGKYWMIENLRLEAAGTVGNNANDASVTNQSLAQGYGGVFSGLASAESTDFTDSTAANSLYKSDGSSDVAGVNEATLNDVGTSDGPGYRIPRYNNTNITAGASSPTDGNANIYAYGNYYSWAAAVANTTNNDTNDTSMATSICPKGWGLPRGGDKDNTTNSDFWSLSVAVAGAIPTNSTTETSPYYTGDPEGVNVSSGLRSFPNNFVYAGIWSGAASNGRGTSASYWTATAEGALNSYSLDISSSVVYPGTGVDNDKAAGLTVRCVAQ